jgi:mRNA-degrading endonuclease RelE of RelBE toxin-antitoxin system
MIISSQRTEYSEMQVILSERVKTALNTLSRDDRERVHTWFDYLRNWEEDAFVKSRSVTLNVQGQSVYMFRTSTAVRIFYTVDEQSKTVSVVDIATKDTILSSGGVSTGES